MSSDRITPEGRFTELLQRFQDALSDGDAVDAEATVPAIFAAVEQWCDRNPSRELDLFMAAARCEEHSDWRGAESAYKQILLLPDLEPFVESRAHVHLAAFYRLLHRDSDSLDHARRATAAARRADLSILLSMALKGESRCLIRCGRISEACHVIAEAISVIDDDTMCNQMRASILTLRAECAIRSGDAADAERDLEHAYNLLAPLAGMEIAAGVHQDLAHWWSVTAELRTARDDRSGAIAAWQKAVSVSMHVASLPQAENVYAKRTVAEMLKGLANALLIGGREDDSATAFGECCEVLKTIGVPDIDAEPAPAPEPAAESVTDGESSPPAR